ncbi:hypothetical protein [Mycoplasma capricolum]|uniref:Membrane protein, putative n=1 Tax=Mycoplasma capricolum subsp. capricolum (strain California kid / ATCC 27343 / NCTC 10154) TaxID=340047 RepID=Q2SR51_MYCCT|nr:hypothetical protein [Mycoplasma capricolum]ABC01310.1 membrane protein, putative [Mycoplasma capricolum subsp. capricolum ATCC 27343]
MKNNFKLFIITFVCTMFFLWYYANIDDIVLYSIPINKNDESVKITMGSSNWVEEWNKILNTNFYSTTPINVWKERIDIAGLKLYGFIEHNSILSYLITLSKVGFGSLCFFLLTFFCKRTIFNPFRSVFRYLKNRNNYITLEMNQTLNFLNKLDKKVKKRKKKKVLKSINDFKIISYKPVYLIRLIDDLRNSFLTDKLKYEWSYYEKLISLVIGYIEEIINKERKAIKNHNKPDELFPVVKRAIEYYSTKSSYYNYYCINASQKNRDSIEIIITTNTNFYIASLFVINFAFFIISFFIIGFAINFIWFKKIDFQIFSSLRIILPFILTASLLSIIITSLYVSKQTKSFNNIIENKKYKKNKSNFDRKNYLYIILYFLILLIFLVPIFSYGKLLSEIEPDFTKQNDPLLTGKIDVIMYNILFSSLMIYWFCSLDDLLRKENKITILLCIKNVIPQVFCFIFFMIISYCFKHSWQGNYSRLVLLILILEWVFLILFEPVIYNIFYFSYYKCCVGFKFIKEKIKKINL